MPVLVKDSVKRYFFSPFVTLQTTLELSELKTTGGVDAAAGLAVAARTKVGVAHAAPRATVRRAGRLTCSFAVVSELPSYSPPPPDEAAAAQYIGARSFQEKRAICCGRNSLARTQ